MNESLKPVVPFKFSTITNHYNQLLLNFRGNYSVEFRVFDDGIAYRFITDKKGEVEVTNELFQVSLPEEYLLHVQQSDGLRQLMRSLTAIYVQMNGTGLQTNILYCRF